MSVHDELYSFRYRSAAVPNKTPYRASTVDVVYRKNIHIVGVKIKEKFTLFVYHKVTFLYESSSELNLCHAVF